MLCAMKGNLRFDQRGLTSGWKWGAVDQRRKESETEQGQHPAARQRAGPREEA